MLFTRLGEVAVASAAVFGPQASNAEAILQQLLLGDPTDSPARLPFGDLAVASGLARREVRKLDRFSLMAVAAARQALQDAELPSVAVRACGVLTGNVLAGWTFTEPQLEALWRQGPKAVNPYLATAWFPAAPQGQITIHLGLRGFAKTVTTDRSAGAQALGLAYGRLLAEQDSWMLAGGVEAPCTPLVEEAWRQSDHAERLEEGAAYLLLGPPEASSIHLVAHIEGRLSLGLGDLQLFCDALPDRGDAFLCGVIADFPSSSRAALDGVLGGHPRTAGARVVHRSAVFGEALAASAGQAAAAAVAWVSREGPGSEVLVLSGGERMTHALLFRNNSPSPESIH